MLENIWIFLHNREFFVGEFFYFIYFNRVISFFMKIKISVTILKGLICIFHWFRLVYVLYKCDQAIYSEFSKCYQNNRNRTFYLKSSVKSLLKYRSFKLISFHFIFNLLLRKMFIFWHLFCISVVQLLQDFNNSLIIYTWFSLLVHINFICTCIHI